MYKPSFVREGGVIEFGSGEQFDTSRYDQLPDLRDRLQELRKRAVKMDEDELQIAVDGLKGYCNDGWDEKRSRANYSGIVQANDEVWEQFYVHYKRIWGTRDNPETILNTTYKDWQQAVDDLAAVEQQVPGLTVDSWQGDAANSYRARLPQRLLEVQRAKSLAEGSRNGIEAVAYLQAAILDALYEAMLAYADQIESYLNGTAFKDSVLEEKFKNSYWDFKWNNRAAHDFQFYRRTKTVTAYIEDMAKHAGLKLDNQTDGEWVPSSEEIRVYLEETLEAAKSGREIEDFGGEGYNPDQGPIDVDEQEGKRMET